MGIGLRQKPIGECNPRVLLKVLLNSDMTASFTRTPGPASKFLSNRSISRSSSNSFSPNVAINDNGDTIVTWREYDTYPRFQIFISEYRDGGPWVHPADRDDNISPDNNQCTGAPILAIDNNGNTIIVWEQYNLYGRIKLFKNDFVNVKSRCNCSGI